MFSMDDSYKVDVIKAGIERDYSKTKRHLKEDIDWLISDLQKINQDIDNENTLDRIRLIQNRTSEIDIQIAKLNILKGMIDRL